MTFNPYRRIILLVLISISPFALKAQTTKVVLLQGIDSIPMPPEPNGISLFTLINDRPEIIAMTKLEFQETLKSSAIVTSSLGKGKILAIGATTYFNHEMLKNSKVEQLIRNMLAWAGAGNKKLHVAITEAADPALRDFLLKQKASVYTIKNFDFKKQTDLLMLNTDVPDSTQLKKIDDFVSNGGRLIYASPYPDWFEHRDTTKDPQYYDIKLNNLLAKAGVVNLNALTMQSPNNNKLVTDSVADYLSFHGIVARAFKEIATSNDDIIRQLFVDPTLYLVYKYGEYNSESIKYINKFFKLPEVMPIPTEEKPWLINTPALKTVARIGYELYSKQQDFNNRPEAKAAGYETFPGYVTETAARVKEEITIPVKVGTQGLPDMPSVYYRPHSTGLYVSAGEKVKVIINTGDIGQRLKAQIGVHNDNVTHLDEIHRVPVDMTKTFELDKDTTEVYSPYGGLLLINIGDTSTLKTIKLKVEGAVKAPYFKLGETSEEDWNNTIRNNPAPWAELATDNIVFTVPSDHVRNLSNPVKLMQFWDEVMDADADLAGISRKRVHNERIIVDVDVAAGALYAVPYKIVAPNDKNSWNMLNETFMRANGLWGHFHELGHRHQFFDLDFPGTTEVTVNLFTMYVFDKVLHKGIYNHEGMDNMDDVLKKVKAYLADKPSYEKWSNDPFLALSMYIQLIDRFGWDPIKKANAIYRNLPKEQYPKTDQDKRDLWFTTICKTTNSNLSRFFDVWRIPVSDSAKKQVTVYKPWFPVALESK